MWHKHTAQSENSPSCCIAHGEIQMALLCQLPFVSESGWSAGKKSGDPDLRDAIGHLRWAPPVHSLMHLIMSSFIMQNRHLLIEFLHFEHPLTPEMSLHSTTQVAIPI